MSNVSMVPDSDEQNASVQNSGQDETASGPDNQSDLWHRLVRDVAVGGTRFKLLQEAFQHAFGGVMKQFEDDAGHPATADAAANPATAAATTAAVTPPKDGTSAAATPATSDQASAPADPNLQQTAAPITKPLAGAESGTAATPALHHPLDPVTTPASSPSGGQLRTFSGHFHRIQLSPKDDPKVVVDGFYAFLPKVAERLKQAAALSPLTKTGAFDPASVLQRGYFTNAEGPDAQNFFVFMDPLTQKPVMGPDGQPLSFSKDQVVAAGAAARSQQVTIRVPSVGSVQVTEADRLKLQYPSDLQDRAKELGDKELDALSMLMGPAGKIIKGGVWTWRAIQAFRAYRAAKRLLELSPKIENKQNIVPEPPAADKTGLEPEGETGSIPPLLSKPNDLVEGSSPVTSTAYRQDLAAKAGGPSAGNQTPNNSGNIPKYSNDSPDIDSVGVIPDGFQSVTTPEASSASEPSKIAASVVKETPLRIKDLFRTKRQKEPDGSPNYIVAADELRARIKDTISNDGKVVLYPEGVAVDVAGVTDTGKIADSNGRQWNALDLVKNNDQNANVISFTPPQMGGIHKKIKVLAGYERHHMPSDANSPYSKAKGLAINMLIEDHEQTVSWGNTREGSKFRKVEAKLIAEEKYEEAMQLSIDNVRQLFGNKYDVAIDKMLEVARKEKYIL